ncbi:hypothetical protein BSNK01_31220 [Bacillaceae bacterium]
MADKNDKKRMKNNPELEEIATHMAGATTLHHTQQKENERTIKAPPVSEPGPYDTREK